MPHLNYGLLLWGVNLKNIFLLQKKAMRLVTHNSYTSHTEPIFRENGLLNLADMFLLNKLKNFYTNYFITIYHHIFKHTGNMPRHQFQKSISDCKIRNVTQISTFCSHNLKCDRKMLKVAVIIRNVTAKC